jgi:hypothetical protein
MNAPRERKIRIAAEVVPAGAHPTLLQRLRGLVGAVVLIMVGGVLLAVAVAVAVAVAAFLAAQAFG